MLAALIILFIFITFVSFEVMSRIFTFYIQSDGFFLLLRKNFLQAAKDSLSPQSWLYFQDLRVQSCSVNWLSVANAECVLLVRNFKEISQKMCKTEWNHDNHHTCKLRAYRRLFAFNITKITSNWFLLLLFYKMIKLGKFLNNFKG